MNDDRDDERLRRVFAELRQADHAAIPPFGRVWASATARSRRRRHRIRWIAASASAAAAVVVAVMLLERPTTLDLEAATRLAAWQSPTASLLRAPGEEILKAVPSVRSSLVRLETLQPAAPSP